MDKREDYLDIDSAADRLAGWVFGDQIPTTAEVAPRTSLMEGGAHA